MTEQIESLVKLNDFMDSIDTSPASFKKMSKRPPGVIPDKVKADILRWRATGESLGMLSFRTGLDKMVISRFLKEQGVAKHPKFGGRMTFRKDT